MNHIETLTRYLANFIDELTHQGVKDVVISPGSRSTPLAMLAVDNKSIRDWILVDERSASYFALGLAKKTNRPVALICTSGTAAANYYPAVIEAFHGRVPLIVLTADRPHELRDVGAPQAMNQLNLYGDFVKKFYEMSLPEATDEMINYVRNRAKRASFYAQSGNPGPVQLNFPIREPLTPDLTLPNLWSEIDHLRQSKSVIGKRVLDQQSITDFIKKLEVKKRPIIVCGPQTDKYLSELIINLSNDLNVPVIADSLSQVRSATHNHSKIINSADALLKKKSVRDKLAPDMIIRFGGMPISKSYLFFLQENSHVPHYVIENETDVREPTNQQANYLLTDGSLFIESLLTKDIQLEISHWTNKWVTYNQLVQKELTKSKNNHDFLTEGGVIQALLDKIPHQSDLFIANSMPVRDLDTYYEVSEKEIFIHGNRGVSGIDGVVSTALGIAAVSEKPVTLVIGDLSFYHDLNGLLAAKKYEIDITILLINNDGGGIFSFLPQAKEGQYFEKLFGTPLGIDFSHSVKMYNGTYTLATDMTELNQLLTTSYQTKGLKVIEIRTDRKENVALHQDFWRKIEQVVLEADQNE